jgi:nitroreductase
MDLRTALRSTPATRSFTAAPISDDTIREILDDARFAPSGGNRQGWRVVILKDPAIRRQIRDVYLEGWYEYLGQVMAGMTPFAPTNDREAEAIARAHAPAMAEMGAASPGFAEQLDEVPCLLLLLADLSCLAATDRDLDRYTFIGGGSIYPFAWNILLGARSRGLGGVITTMPVLNEDKVKRIVGAPADLAVAGLIALGEPSATVTKLRRSPVEEFTTIDTVDGPAF